MSIPLALALCAAGLFLVIFCAERLVKGAVGTSPPACPLTMVVVAGFMSTRQVSRAAGAVLVALYLVFVGGAFVWG